VKSDNTRSPATADEITRGLERTIEWYAAKLAPPHSIDDRLLGPKVRLHGS